MWVISLMVASSVLSMSIRQIRHLQEVPSDFFRLPIFILTSTFFLMPVRLLGFFRMAHVAGWGTRAGAYAGGDAPTTGTSGTTAGDLDGPAPVDVVDRDGDCDGPLDPWPPTGLRGAEQPAEGSLLLAPSRRLARTVAAAPAAAVPARGRRFNPWAAVPYVIGLTILSLEALLYV